MFKFFKKPALTYDEMDNMPISQLIKTKQNIYYKGAICEPDKDTLTDLISARIKTLVENTVDTILTIEVAGVDNKVLEITTETFNNKVKDFVNENKLHGYQYNSSGYFTGYYFEDNPSIIIESLSVHEYINFSTSNTIKSSAKQIIDKIEANKESFDEMVKVVTPYQYLVPTVDYVQLSSSSPWEVNGLYITPEMLEGYMAAVTPVLDDEEAANGLRHKIINSFRLASGGNPSVIDYNRPSVSVPTPEKWKQTYYEDIKPAEERRERCKDVLEEIKGTITAEEIIDTLKREKLMDKLNYLTDGQIVKQFPEDFKYIHHFE